MSINFNCPECNTEIEVPDDFAGRKGKCPECGHVMTVPGEPSAPSTMTERDPVPPESHFADAPHVRSAGANTFDELPPVPMEETDRPFLGRFVGTVGMVLLRPSEFFARLKRSTSFNQAIVFFLILLCLATFSKGLVLFIGPEADQTEMQKMLFEKLNLPNQPQPSQFQEIQNSPALKALSLFANFILGLFGFFVGGLILHLCAMLCRCAGQGLEGTLKMLCYAHTPFLLAASLPIPGINFTLLLLAGISHIVGSVWMLIVEIIGLKEMSGAAYGNAIIAALLPIALFIFCCCGCFAAVAIFGGLLAGAQGV